MTYLVSVPADAGLTAPYAWLVSSLAGSFRPAATAEIVAPDVVVVDGRGPDWVERAGVAIASGARAVVVAQPHPVPPDGVAELDRQASVAGVLVGVDLWFRSDPAWTAVLPELVADAATAAVLTCSVRLPPPARPDAGGLQHALLAQLALVRPLLAGGAGLALQTSQPGGHHVMTGTGPGAAVSLTGAVAAGAGVEAEVTLAGVERRWQICLHADADAQARPATVSAMDTAGSHARRPHHESGLRAGWRALHSALDGTGDVGYGLAALTADLTLLASAQS